MKLGPNVAKFTECDCGCNNPVAESETEMLEFLLQRFSQCGVGDAVAAVYARDIKKLLENRYSGSSRDLKSCPLSNG